LRLVRGFWSHTVHLSPEKRCQDARGRVAKLAKQTIIRSYRPDRGSLGTDWWRYDEWRMHMHMHPFVVALAALAL